MIGAILAALVAAAAPTGDSVPDTALASTSPLSPEAAALADARENLERVQTLYTQSCDNRAYGAYDDMCNQLSHQLHQYHVDLDKLERAAANKKPSTPPPAPKS
jgi:hypothetical protein